MAKPKILVTSAAGHTGAPAVRELLSMGFPVRAFVRRDDRRSEQLRDAGAEIFVGNLFDFRDLQAAMAGVQRAYHCPPFAPHALHGASLFALAAEEAKLEVVALMTAWNPHAAHPSIFTRELWITQSIGRWMPSVDIVHINPGLFAFPYFLGVPLTVNLGVLMLPFGDGLNAPPANEDIASVVAAVLAEPAEHIGKRYRPTGPRLIAPADAAEAMSRVLGRTVRHRDVSTRMFIKAARAQGFPLWQIAQIRHYAEEMRAGAYAVGAPTDHVEQVCGRPAEPFETTARRYLESPDLVAPGLRLGGVASAVLLALRTMVTTAPDLDAWEDRRGRPALSDSLLAHECPKWFASAQRQDLNLPPSAKPASPSSAPLSAMG